MGTPLYMSPEQVQGQEVDPRSDIYSLGVTCYHMFAGQPPFRGQTGFEVAVQHVQKEPAPLSEVRPDLPPELSAIIHKMLLKDPKTRYQTGRELIRDLTLLRENLANVLGGQKTQSLALDSSRPVLTPVAGSPGVSSTALRPPPRTRWIKAVAALSVLLALLGGAAFRLWQDRPRLPAVAGDPSSHPIVPNVREKMLLEAIAQTAAPTDARQLRRGLNDRIDLGLLYLEQNRLAEADRFFNQLIQGTSSKKAYSTLGKLGQAMVLAFQNQTRASNLLFMELVKDNILADRLIREKAPDDKKGGPGRWFLNNHPYLREMVARAVDFNYRADPRAFPKELDPLRLIPGVGTEPSRPK
jgi:serine/threonine-protein kinase